MRAIISIIIVALASVTTVNGQDIFFSSYTEQTTVSPSIGVQVGYEFSYGYEVAVFYQKEMGLKPLEEGQTSTLREEDFKGILIGGPIIMRDRYNVKINVRTGARSKYNFVISPSFVGNYKLVDAVQVQLGVGVRGLRPTFQAGLRINL